MSARISNPYQDGLSGQQQLMVQSLVSNACSLLADAAVSAKTGTAHRQIDFISRIEQLMRQREQVAEAVSWHLEAADDRYEAVNLQWVIEDLCRRAVIRALEATAAGAEANGNADLERTATAALRYVRASAVQPGGSEGARPIPWVVHAVQAA